MPRPPDGLGGKAAAAKASKPRMIEAGKVAKMWEFKARSEGGLEIVHDTVEGTSTMKVVNRSKPKAQGGPEHVKMRKI